MTFFCLPVGAGIGSGISMSSSSGMGFGTGFLEKDVLKLNLNEKEVLNSINNRFANYIEKGKLLINCIAVSKFIYDLTEDSHQSIIDRKLVFIMITKKKQ